MRGKTQVCSRRFIFVFFVIFLPGDKPVGEGGICIFSQTNSEELKRMFFAARKTPCIQRRLRIREAFAFNYSFNLRPHLISPHRTQITPRQYLARMDQRPEPVIDPGIGIDMI